MIIDCILDRKHHDETVKQGYTHARRCDGAIIDLRYDPHDFYMDIMQYVGGAGSAHAERITWAMDNGTETDVKMALCWYVIACEYNPEICTYINSVRWLESARGDNDG